MNSLKIVATISVKENYIEELKNIFHTVVDATRMEEGCISYDLHSDVNNPLVFVILEEWKNQEAIDFHNKSQHFQNFKKGIDGKIDNLKIDVIKKIY